MVFLFRFQSRFLRLNIEADLRTNTFHQQIQAFIAQNGMKNLNESIKSMIENERLEPLLIAIIGETGVGKSTFINTLRGLSRSDPAAAKTDSSKECTMQVNVYPDPRNPNLLIYHDLPGIGSANFSIAEYTKKIPLEHYDFFILLSYNRLKESDVYLAKEIQRLKKELYFVRTRIDQSLNEEREDNDGNPFDEGDFVNRVRATTENLVKETIGDCPVFVISSLLKNYTKWDFPTLVQALMNGAPDLKKEIIIRTITANSLEAIDQKVTVLKQRIFMIAVAAAAVGAVPIPFLPFACNLSIITREIHRYITDFGLDQASLESLATKYHMTRIEFQKRIFDTSSILQSNEESVISAAVQKVLTEAAAANVAGECARITPIIGQIVPCVTSFLVVTYALETLLEGIRVSAIKLVEELVRLDQ